MEFDLVRAGSDRLADALPLVAAFHADEGVAQTDAERREAVSTLLANPGYGELWLMEARGRAFGYLVFAFGYSLEFRGRDVFLDEIYVDPDFRRKGVARRAVREMIADLKARGVKAAHLEVALEKTAAQDFYAAEGFELRTRYKLMSNRFG